MEEKIKKEFETPTDPVTDKAPIKEESKYRTVTDVLEELAKAQAVVEKLWFELWRFYK
ncbi:hypothetical protein LCGC14_2918530 [marine sediment metagenome]|uniref:Uncharacterized protein n=1 Tax=marine sediment metagenome TaxID=412755 RepID=A0A0F8XPU3_9ZZZZ